MQVPEQRDFSNNGVLVCAFQLRARDHFDGNSIAALLR